MIGKAVIGLCGGMLERDGTFSQNLFAELRKRALPCHRDSDRWPRRGALGVRAMLQTELAARSHGGQ